jgi:SAM-dependent methyltransferase
MRIGAAVMAALIGAGADDHIVRLVAGGARTALDVGCGQSSPFSRFRPGLTVVGVDSDEPSIAYARRLGIVDRAIRADFMRSTDGEICAPINGDRYDIVGSFGVIEHIQKDDGFAFLNRLESLSSGHVIVTTPNGFLPQGPEYDNPQQRHLSGWFANEFRARGYSVFGCDGTRLIRGYAGLPKVNFRYWALADAALARALATRSRPDRFAFTLVAIKDVRGVPARLGRHPRRVGLAAAE